MAVLLSGNVRDVSSTGPLIQEMVVAPLDADVFIHTWSSVDHSTETWWRSPSGAVDAEQTVPQVDENELRRLFLPRRLVVEPAKDFSTDQHSGETAQRTSWFPSVTSMWFGVGAAWDLMEQQESADRLEYQHVVRWRFDLLPSRPLSDRDLTDGLLLAHSERYSVFSIPGDVSAIGPRADMKTYAAVYGRLPSLFEEHENASPLADFRPESMLALHLKQQHVAWDEIRCGLRLQRPGGGKLVIATDEPWVRASHFDHGYIAGQLRQESEGCANEYVIRNLENAGCQDACEVADLLERRTGFPSWPEIRRAGSLMNAARNVLNSQSDHGPSVGDAVYWQWWVDSFEASQPMQRTMLLAGAGPWIPGWGVFCRWVRRIIRAVRRRVAAALHRVGSR